jgi:regulatory protein
VSDYCLKNALQQIDETEYLATLKKLIAIKRRTITEKNPVKLKYKLMSYALSKGYEKDLVFDVLGDRDGDDDQYMGS